MYRKDRIDNAIKKYLNKSTHSLPRQTQACPSEAELFDYLNNQLPKDRQGLISRHLETCRYCLEQIDIAMRAKGIKKNHSIQVISFINRTKWLIASAAAFILSFFVHKYFIQFLTIAALSGIKYIIDTRTNKTLIMVKDAWQTNDTNRLRHILDKEENKMRF